MTTPRRGGNPQAEREHSRVLLRQGAGETWGWNTPAGRLRVARRCAWMTEALGLKPGMRVLECGCGTGIFTRGMAGGGAEITAVDIAQDLLAEAARLTDAPNVRFLEDDLERPAHLGPESFDAVYGVSVLHHLDLPAALAALGRVLKPGARFAFSEPNIANPINRYYLYVDDVDKRRARGQSPNEMAFTRAELGRTLAEHGFVPEVLDHRDFMHPAFPEALLPLVSMVERAAEALPLVRRISGSLWAAGTYRPAQA